MKTLKDKSLQLFSSHYCQILRWIVHALELFNLNDNPEGIHHYRCFVYYDVIDTQGFCGTCWGQVAYKAGNHHDNWAYTPAEVLVVPPHWLPSFVN